MTKLAHVEHELAIGILKANVTPLVVAKQYRCHGRTIKRLKNCFQQIGTTSHRPRPGRQSQLGHPKGLIIQKSGLKL